ncbi:10140_t:CDS:2 [Ambispora gerdemannii]|uniref:10140_t:CDS:1 n=1 Tax=Ambispora gerdemannii TaxID=144530 RepID=A0A9N8V156_9GLOM|nr:10140_t:CDS:2 [Ambispora gerdemannii]
MAFSNQSNWSNPQYSRDEQIRSVEDLDRKRRAIFQEIDNTQFGWFHIRTCIVTGIGFFTDAYDLFVINLVSSMLGIIYFEGNLPHNIDLGLKMSAAVGTLIGQIFFGIAADRYGRKKMYGYELSIMIIATLGQSLSGESRTLPIYTSIIMWRILLGIGIGGDYPMSAVITSEFATKNRRGSMMAAVFSTQGFGILSAAICSVCVLAIYKEEIQLNSLNVDYVWRIVTGIGILPACVALYFRLTIPETPRYTIDVERNIDQATNDVLLVVKQGKSAVMIDDYTSVYIDVPRHNWEDFKSYFGKWENAKILIGTSLSWFVLDIAFYGIGLNNSIILHAIGFSDSTDTYKQLWNMSVGNILVSMLGTVPGYWFTVIFIEKWGRKFIQKMGFLVLTVLFLILGFGYEIIKETSLVLFITLFSLSQFFLNFGPNSTTFIIPGEVFPTRYRSTGHGISAAWGKFGAIIAQIGFIQLKDKGGPNAFVNRLLIFFAVFMFFGFVITHFLVPETKKQSLEQLSKEKQIGFVRERVPPGLVVPFPDEFYDDDEYNAYLQHQVVAGSSRDPQFMTGWSESEVEPTRLANDFPKCDTTP